MCVGILYRFGKVKKIDLKSLFYNIKNKFVGRTGKEQPSYVSRFFTNLDFDEKEIYANTLKNNNMQCLAWFLLI